MDLISSAIKNTIEQFVIKSIDEFESQEKFTKMILKHPVNLYVPKYKEKYSFEDSFWLSYSCLETISKEYAERLIRRKEEYAFIVDYRSESKNKNAYSNEINGKPIIYIPYTSNLDCSFEITHESIHDMSIIGGYNDTRALFCEILSIYAEKYQSIYFGEINIRESIIRPRKIQNYIYLKALILDFELELIRRFLNNGYVKNSDIESLMKNHNYDKNLLYYLYSVAKSQELIFVKEQRYMYGYVLASYMLERFEKTKNNIEFLDLNENINNYTVEQFLNYLDIDATYENYEIKIDDKSYKNIEDIYVKQLKKIR